MNTHTGGGFLAGLKRSFGGGSFFITDFTASGPGHVAFAPRFPGTIVPALLQPGQSLICRKETFLVAEKSVDARDSPGRSGSAPASSAATASSCRR